MVTTSPDNLVTPDAGSQYALTADLALLASRAQAMGNNIRASWPAEPVANASARNARYPSPTQGASVYRLDLGYVERYYASYNATTNPQGASAAGWYPENRLFIAARTGTQTINTGWQTITTAYTEIKNDGLGAFTGGAFIPVAAGIYRISTSVYFANLTSNPFAVQVTKNSSSPDGSGTLVGTLVSGMQGTELTTTEVLAAGDQIRQLVYSSGSTSIATFGTIGARMTVEKLQ